MDREQSPVSHDTLSHSGGAVGSSARVVKTYKEQGSK